MAEHDPALVEKAARAAREVQIGPLGPNALEIANRGGRFGINSTEAEHIARAVLDAVVPELAVQIAQSGQIWEVAQAHIDKRLAEAREAALNEALAVVKRASDIECHSPGTHTGCAHHEAYRRLRDLVAERREERINE